MEDNTKEVHHQESEEDEIDGDGEPTTTSNFVTKKKKLEAPRKLQIGEYVDIFDPYDQLPKVRWEDHFLYDLVTTTQGQMLEIKPKDGYLTRRIIHGQVGDIQSSSTSATQVQYLTGDDERLLDDPKHLLAPMHSTTTNSTTTTATTFKLKAKPPKPRPRAQSTGEDETIKPGPVGDEVSSSSEEEELEITKRARSTSETSAGRRDSKYSDDDDDDEINDDDNHDDGDYFIAAGNESEMSDGGDGINE